MKRIKIDDINKRMKQMMQQLRQGRRSSDFLDELRANRAAEVARERKRPGRQIGLFDEEA